MNTHHIEMYYILLESWEGIGHCPSDRIEIGHLVVEGSGVKSKSTSINTSDITEVNPMNIHHMGTYLILLGS